MLRFILPAFLVGFVVLFYNNCGQRGFNVEQATVPVEKLQQDMVLMYKAGFAPAQCAEPAMFECLQRVYSQDVENGKRDIDFPCVQLPGGQEVCLAGEQFNFNSADAMKNCKEDCTDIYEFEEFTCAYKLPNANGSYPLRATADQFQDAVIGAYEACLKVATSDLGKEQ